MKTLRISAVFASLALISACAQQQDTPVSPPVTQASQPLAGSSAVSGQVQVTQLCGGHATLYLKSGNQVVYSTSVQNGATFELQAMPGTYVLEADGSNGCVQQQQVTLTANQTTQVTITLMQSTPTNPTTAGTTPTTGTTGYPPPPGYGNCTYGGYGCSTGYYSCPWGTYGCYGGYYPGGGGGFVGKPNIYLSGVQGTKVSVKVRFGDSSNLLAAVPIHGADGWSGALTSGDRVVVGNTAYDYLYYDLRFDPNKIQSSEAFCVDRAELLPSLLGFLKDRGFGAREISDFQSYWSAHMPRVAKYCVYPQENADISGAAELEVTPKPDTLTRVWFFIVPEQTKSAMTTKSKSALFAKFTAKPKHLIAATRPSVAPGRKIASGGITKPFEVREWGVGFLVQDPADLPTPPQKH